MRARDPYRKHSLCLISALLFAATSLLADQVPVHHNEGRLRGFLVLRDLDENILASGDLSQVTNGTRVTNELTFRFKDGSIQEETTVFSQRRVFQLLTYHLVQKGPAFKRPTDMFLNTSTGEVATHYTDKDGKDKSVTERLKVPADVANGLIPTLLSDIDPKSPKTTLSMVVSTPKPRLVKLEISPVDKASFSIGGSARSAIIYAIKIEIGGIGGVIAPIVGKQPSDMHIWMVGGKAPGFVKLEGQLYEGGPVWRIELASPVWPGLSRPRLN